MAPIVIAARPFMKSPKKGADTAVYLASSPEVEGVTSRYFANRKIKKSHDSSYDVMTTGRLWQVSADLVGPPAKAHGRSSGNESENREWRIRKQMAVAHRASIAREGAMEGEGTRNDAR